jgi:hypothetical protein
MSSPLRVDTNTPQHQPGHGDLRIALERIEDVADRHDAAMTTLASAIREDRKDSREVLEAVIRLSTGNNRQTVIMIVSLAVLAVSSVLTLFGHATDIQIPGLHIGTGQ